MHFAGSHGGVGGAVAALAPGGGSAGVCMIHAAVFFPGNVAGLTDDMGAVVLLCFGDGPRVSRKRR
jgi:hypothetical protein